MPWWWRNKERKKEDSDPAIPTFYCLFVPLHCGKNSPIVWWLLLHLSVLYTDFSLATRIVEHKVGNSKCHERIYWFALNINSKIGNLNVQGCNFWLCFNFCKPFLSKPFNIWRLFVGCLVFGMWKYQDLFGISQWILVMVLYLVNNLPSFEHQIATPSNALIQNEKCVFCLCMVEIESKYLQLQACVCLKCTLYKLKLLVFFLKSGGLKGRNERV
jgi:hypothetical protein